MDARRAWPIAAAVLRSSAWRSRTRAPWKQDEHACSCAIISRSQFCRQHQQVRATDSSLSFPPSSAVGKPNSNPKLFQRSGQTPAHSRSRGPLGARSRSQSLAVARCSSRERCSCSRLHADSSRARRAAHERQRAARRSSLGSKCTSAESAKANIQTRQRPPAE